MGSLITRDAYVTDAERADEYALDHCIDEVTVAILTGYVTALMIEHSSIDSVADYLFILACSPPDKVTAGVDALGNGNGSGHAS